MLKLPAGIPRDRQSTVFFSLMVFVACALAPIANGADTLLGTQTYSAGGSSTSYTVPAGTKYIVVKAWGAGGGGGGAGSADFGGTGAFVTAYYLANPGDTFQVSIGAGGYANPSAASLHITSDGPNGGTGGAEESCNGGGGGGGTSVITPYGTVWAGGGGGAGVSSSTFGGGAGGNGGAPIGATGGGSQSNLLYNGVGGTASSGGVGAQAYGSGSGTGNHGGSAGVWEGDDNLSYGYYGGGGGGGLYGGGAGAQEGDADAVGGGGGGSSSGSGSVYNLLFQVGGVLDVDYPGGNVGAGGTGTGSVNAPGNGAVVIKAYSLASSPAPQTTFFPSTVPQTYTVPNGVGTLVIKAWGGGGGAGIHAGGAGGYATASYTVYPGQILSITAGLGGLGGSSSGSTGSTSVVTAQSTTLMSVAGGGGGTSSSVGADAQIGSSTIADNIASPVAAQILAGSSGAAANSGDNLYPGGNISCGGTSAAFAGNGGNGAIVILAYPQVPVVTSSLLVGSQPNQTVNYQLLLAFNPTSISVSGLPAGLSYNTSTGYISGTISASTGSYPATVTATNANGTSETTLEWYIDNTPPQPPTGLTNTTPTYNSVGLSWNASTDDLSGVAAYQISVNGFATTTIAAPSGSTVNTVLGGLDPNTTYAIAVQAIDLAGNQSTWCTAINVTTAPDTTPPTVPTVLHTSSISATFLTLNWNQSTDNVGVVAYQVQENGSTTVGTTGSNSFSVSGLSPNTAYHFAVRASDAAGNWSAWSPLLPATTVGASGDVLLNSTIFTYNGRAPQSYAIPAGANYIMVKTWGAGGGGGVGFNYYGPTYVAGSGGQFASASFNVNSGDQLSVNVGTGGYGCGSYLTSGQGGWPGGGSGVAQGGGGGGYSSVQTPYGTIWAGGGGGAGGTAYSISNGGNPGTLGQGGVGIGAFVGSHYPGAGGGGGGYYGGGGGYAGFGGPGSSYANGSAFNFNFQPGSVFSTSTSDPDGTYDPYRYWYAQSFISTPIAPGGVADVNYPGNSVGYGEPATVTGGINGASGAVVILAYQTLGANPIQTFYGTGGTQAYTVPAGTDHVVIKSWGAGGGSGGTNSNGGGGAFVSGTYSVTGGQTISVYAGVGGVPPAILPNLPLVGATGGDASVVTLPSGATIFAAGGGGGGTLTSSGGAGGASTGQAGTGGDGSGASGGSTSGSGSSLQGVGGAGGNGDGTTTTEQYDDDGNDEGPSTANVGIGSTGGTGSARDGGLAGSTGSDGCSSSDGIDHAGTGGGGGGGLGGGGGAGSGDSYIGGGGGGGGSSGVLSGSSTTILGGSGATPANISDANYPGNNVGYGGLNGGNGGSGAVVIIVYPITPVINAGNAITITATQNAPINYTISATGGPNLLFTSATLPAGIALNPSTGVISGSISTAGTPSSTVSAQNSTATSSATINWTINADTSAPTAPTVLVANVISLNSVELSWYASSDNVAVTSYQVKSNGTLVGTTAGTSWTVGGLPPGVAYTLGVRASDAVGNWSGWTTITQTMPADTTPPTAATNLNYATISSSTVTLMWTAATDSLSVAGYNVYRNGVLVGTTKDVVFVDTGLAASTAYTYTIVAFDSSGNLSSSSVTLSVTTSADTGTDTDHDGLPDSVETLLGTNPNSSATIDSGNTLQMNLQHPTR